MEISIIKNIFLVVRNDDYISIIKLFRLPPLNKRKKYLIYSRSYYNIDNSMKYFLILYISLTLSQLQIKGNFYITTFINARKISKEQQKINNYLINPNIIINLILEYTIRKIKYIFHNNISIAIRSINGIIDKLLGYINLRVIIISVPKILRLYMVLSKVNYNMILGKPWLKIILTIGLYIIDKYQIKDINNIYYKV